MKRKKIGDEERRDEKIERSGEGIGEVRRAEK